MRSLGDVIMYAFFKDTNKIKVYRTERFKLFEFSNDFMVCQKVEDVRIDLDAQLVYVLRRSMVSW